MLLGTAGARKSTPIKIAIRLLTKAGYSSVSADKTSKEKFLLDLSGAGDLIADEQGKISAEEMMEMNIFGAETKAHIPEILIAADEFNIFTGNGNLEFLALLGQLWDYEGIFKNKVKNSRSVEIDNPYVSILAGNTPTSFSLAFPAEAIGQGIFSRLILIHGEPTGKRITFPRPPAESDTLELAKQLQEIKAKCVGKIELSKGAEKLIDAIYQSMGNLPDVRFDSYVSRKFAHLVKLCIICAVSRLSKRIEEADVIYANTMLTHAESMMPKALGEFGKSKNSDISHKVIQVLESSFTPLSIKDIWKNVTNDLENLDRLKDILSNLVLADKIIADKGKFLARRSMLEEAHVNKFVDFSLLTSEERKHIS